MISKFVPVKSEVLLINMQIIETGLIQIGIHIHSSCFSLFFFHTVSNVSIDPTFSMWQKSSTSISQYTN